MGEDVPKPRRRAYQMQIGRLPGSGGWATRVVRIKGVGRNASRYFCPRCGMRHKLCICSESA